MTTLTPASTQTSTPATHPEIELILCCCRTDIDTATTQRIQTLLQQKIDWAYLVQTASRQQLIPLLYRNLQSTCPDAIPQTILKQLRNHFHANSLHNLFLTKELLQLLNLFQNHNIPAIPFKGPALAVSAYGNLALRQIGDLDILVQEPDYAKAKELLLNQGHQMVHDRKHEANCLQAQLWHQEKQLSVDLHYGIPPKRLQLNSDLFTRNLQPLSLAGTNIQTFSSETYLLLLSIERDKDGGNRLSKICDIAALIRSHPQINWQSLRQQAQKLKLEQPLSLSLVLAHSLFAAPVPTDILSRIKQAPLIRWQASQLVKNPLSEPSYHHPFHLWITTLYQLSTSEGQWTRLLYWLTPNPADQEFLPLPRRLHVLYYLIRPIRLVGKYTLSPLQTLFKPLDQKHRP